MLFLGLESSSMTIFFHFSLLFLLSLPVFSQETEEAMRVNVGKYNSLLDSRYSLFPHKGTYLMPFVYNNLTHESVYSGMKSLENTNEKYYKNTEAEFQVSFLIPIYRRISQTNWDFVFAYTHHSWWQVYNSDWSRPFRETNYNPELFLRKVDPSLKKFLNFDLVAVDMGYAHQSNGQVQILSRSWDRVFARGFFQSPWISVLITGWYRLPEKRDQDDNRDIYNYMGLGEIEVIKSFGRHSIKAKAPLFSHHQGIDVKYSYPWRDQLRWFLSYQAGYGQSLIEYNRPTQRVGVGIALEDLFDNR